MEDYITYLRSMIGNKKVIMVAVGVFILDQEDRLLLQLRSDNQTWGHPGGFMEMGETVTETAKREAFEETGLTLHSLEFFGIYSGIEHERVDQLPSNLFPAQKSVFDDLLSKSKPPFIR